MIVFLRWLIVNKVRKFSLFLIVNLFIYSVIIASSKKIYISIEPFDISGVKPRIADIIVNEIKSKINQSSFHSLVPKETREDNLIQESITLNGKIQLKPIKVQHLFGNYKIIVGRLERFSDTHLLIAKLINANTGMTEAKSSINGSLEYLKSDGVNQLVSEFSIAISRNSFK